MNPRLIESLDYINDLLTEFQRKGCLSNNYLLNSDYDSLIRDRKLYEYHDNSNLYLLLDKGNCNRVYYIINDANEAPNIIANKPLMLEILYRGEMNFPTREQSFWHENGFSTIFIRDLYEAPYKALTLPTYTAEVSLAKTNEEVKFAQELFNSVFDPYSGDFVTDDDAMAYLANKELLIASYDGKYIGALNFYKSGNKFWIGHVAVTHDARGKHCGISLVSDFISKNYESDNTRYALWVQKFNKPAVIMYQSIGFKYVNKSTISMLKI